MRLPSREIVVETSRPNVIVNESQFVNRGRLRRASAPVVATIYSPSTFAMPPVGFVQGFESADSANRLLDRTRDLLQAANEIQYQSIMLQKEQAAQKAEQDATRDILEGAYSSLQSQMSALKGPAAAAGKAAAASAKDDDVQAIKSELQKIATRLDNLEKIVIIHDNYIRKQLGAKEKKD